MLGRDCVFLHTDSCLLIFIKYESSCYVYSCVVRLYIVNCLLNLSMILCVLSVPVFVCVCVCVCVCVY